MGLSHMRGMGLRAALWGRDVPTVVREVRIQEEESILQSRAGEEDARWEELTGFVSRRRCLRTLKGVGAGGQAWHRS